MADCMQHRVVFVTGAGAKAVAIDSWLEAARATRSLMASEGGPCIAGKAGIRWVASFDRASSASKAAILAMTSDLARHDAAQGIGDNCVWSGSMQTPFIREPPAKAQGADVSSMIEQRCKNRSNRQDG